MPRDELRRPSGADCRDLIFDLLRDGATDYRDRPLTRAPGRTRTDFREDRLADAPDQRSGARRRTRAIRRRRWSRGWEGLIAKHAASLYKSGKRTPDWRKLKLVHEQEFVIGGWTEPRQTRALFRRAADRRLRRDAIAALEPRHIRARRAAAAGLRGHIGTGFNESELARVMKLLEPLEITTSPFEVNAENQRAAALGASPSSSRRSSSRNGRPTASCGIRSISDCAMTRRRRTSRGRGRAATFGVRRSTFVVRVTRRLPSRRGANARAGTKNARTREAGTERRTRTASLDQLTARSSRRGRTACSRFPDGDELAVTNLHKMFWPKQKLTKGDLFRYYVRCGAVLLPAIADRPLVMKRFPNGVGGPAVLPAPRARRSRRHPHRHRRRSKSGHRLSAARLKTLLYTTQLAAISQDPWFSRVAAPGVRRLRSLRSRSGRRSAVREGARGGALDSRRARRARRDRACRKPPARMACTSTCRCRRGTPYDAGLIFCQIVAALVVQKHPQLATTERAREGSWHTHLHRLPAEYPRQDARRRLQRARERLRRRLDAESPGRR